MFNDNSTILYSDDIGSEISVVGNYVVQNITNYGKQQNVSTIDTFKKSTLFFTDRFY